MAGPSKSRFTFINLSHPDDLKDQNTIDHIRCSAMTNFGRIRRDRRAKSAKNQIVFELKEPEQTPTNVASSSRIGLETHDSFISSPFTTQTSASRLGGNILDNSQSLSSHTRSAGPSVGFHDPLSYQSLLSSSAPYNPQLGSGHLVGKDREQSLQLHDQAMQMPQQHIDDAEQQTTDGVIGNMAGFLTHHCMTGEFEEWNRHMDGLIRMIELRGGFHTLETEELRVTLAWSDICGSFSQDIPPHFPLPITWLEAVTPAAQPPSAELNLIRSIWAEQLPDAPEWPSTYAILISLLQERPPCTWLEPVLHRLLLHRPIQPGSPPNHSSIIAEVCRLGTLLFLAQIWRSFGYHPVRTVVIRRNLFQVVTTCFAEWNELRVLLLWTLAHATRDADGDEERKQFAVRLGMVANRMGITTWEEIVEHLKIVLWVDGFEEQWNVVGETLIAAATERRQQNLEVFVNELGEGRLIEENSGAETGSWDGLMQQPEEPEL
ncbi:hypothetical protein B0J11DRAFT_223623 [Dendryphion nanum]|uniref:Uncharacterized protein n=1 Tax=Dendryphion nanum TaxID=256645 RepID=A0A9P9E820_9PLEO|nr:hypothetical protein B0J11DRAFT_223623 [Dendryphion nanum]